MVHQAHFPHTLAILQISQFKWNREQSNGSLFSWRGTSLFKAQNRIGAFRESHASLHYTLLICHWYTEFFDIISDPTKIFIDDANLRFSKLNSITEWKINHKKNILWQLVAHIRINYIADRTVVIGASRFMHSTHHFAFPFRLQSASALCVWQSQQKKPPHKSHSAVYQKRVRKVWHHFESEHSSINFVSDRSLNGTNETISSCAVRYHIISCWAQAKLDCINDYVVCLYMRQLHIYLHSEQHSMVQLIIRLLH